MHSSIIIRHLSISSLICKSPSNNLLNIANTKLPLPQHGSSILLGFLQNSSGILEIISSTQSTGVGISAFFFFCVSDGMKCFSITFLNSSGELLA